MIQLASNRGFGVIAALIVLASATVETHAQIPPPPPEVVAMVEEMRLPREITSEHPEPETASAL